MSLLLSTSLLILGSNAISPISDTWLDDFAYDINGIDGWDDHNIIDGTLSKYHGWYVKHDDEPPTLSRSFQCDQSSHIQLSFIIYFGCNIEHNDSLIVFFNDEEKEDISWSNLENSPQIYDVDEPNAISTCTATPNYGFKGSNQTMNISENPIDGSTTFVIKFEFILSGVANEFQGISDIKIQCIPASLTTSDESTWLDWIFLHETIIIAICCTLIGVCCGIRIAIYGNKILRRKEARKDSTEIHHHTATSHNLHLPTNVLSNVPSRSTDFHHHVVTAETPSSGSVNAKSDQFGIGINDTIIDILASDDSDDILSDDMYINKDEETPMAPMRNNGGSRMMVYAHRVQSVPGHANLMLTRRASEKSINSNATKYSNEGRKHKISTDNVMGVQMTEF